ncbi:MAG: hypothetical protein IKU90_05810, partial [Clostridia bacterium]|nr:hypothetical protein [Clostridia bacterium]
ATDINPLPPFACCPACRTVTFYGAGMPLDLRPRPCSCGEPMVADGYDIPFESNLKNVAKSHIQLGVSHAFFEEVKGMIYDEMWDKAIITLRNAPVAPTWFCFLDREENDDGDFVSDGNTELFAELPRITLVPVKVLDKYRELEANTGCKIKDISIQDLWDTLPDPIEWCFDGCAAPSNGFMQSLIQTTAPQSYEDVLKLIGFAHATNVWLDNAEILYDNHRVSLREIPAYREDLYGMIRDRLQRQGLYDTGLANDVMEKARRGYYARSDGMDGITASVLMSLGFSMDFLLFLEKIHYMFPKAHGVSYLKEAVIMTYYKERFPTEYHAVTSAEAE